MVLCGGGCDDYDANDGDNDDDDRVGNLSDNDDDSGVDDDGKDGYSDGYHNGN